MQLSESNDKFTSEGVNIIAITHDSEQLAKKFHDQRGLPFPILQDAGSVLIKELGILNTSIDKDSSVYGIPYPGIFLVDNKGVIKAKFAEEDFRNRPELDHLLEAVKAL